MFDQICFCYRSLFIVIFRWQSQTKARQTIHHKAHTDWLTDWLTRSDGGDQDDADDDGDQSGRHEEGDGPASNFAWRRSNGKLG